MSMRVSTTRSRPITQPNVPVVQVGTYTNPTPFGPPALEVVCILQFDSAGRYVSGYKRLGRSALSLRYRSFDALPDELCTSLPRLSLGQLKFELLDIFRGLDLIALRQKMASLWVEQHCQRLGSFVPGRLRTPRMLDLYYMTYFKNHATSQTSATAEPLATLPAIGYDG